MVLSKYLIFDPSRSQKPCLENPANSSVLYLHSRRHDVATCLGAGKRGFPKHSYSMEWTEASERSYPRLPSPFHKTSPPPILITQGAEGHLFRTTFLNKETPAALKVRSSKTYRHAALDQRLTKQRVLAEARILLKVSNAGITVPEVYALDWDVEGGDDAPLQEPKGTNVPCRAKAGAWLLMEWIDGSSVRYLLRERDRLAKAGSLSADADLRNDSVRILLRKIGRAVGKLHSVAGVVHGDLTTSNIIIRPRLSEGDGEDQSIVDKNQHTNLNLEGDVVLIDFGLATQSIQDEDRAVDLYVLEKAFGSTHPAQEELFVEELLQSRDGYKGAFKGSQVVLKRLEEVRTRGRKRSMLG
jgi:TP53 regulating kinase and related kinases